MACGWAGPTMEVARRRRYWLVFTMIIENLFFSAVLLGWSSLLPVLLEEGFFSNSCLDNYDYDYEQNITDAYPINDNETASSVPSSSYTLPEGRYGRPVYPRCSEQDANMNLAFTVGSFLLSGLTFPIGMAMDKFGCRILRMLGSSMFIASCLLFGWATVDASWLLFPAVSLNGVGGIILTFTSFQIANLFGTKRSTVISLNIGSYASAAILFLILKSLYDLGLSRQQIFTAVAIACVFVIINCYINVPMDPIPDPEDATFGMHWNIFAGTHHKLTGQKFQNIVQTVGRRLSVDNSKTDDDIFPITYQGMNRKNSKMYSSHELLPTSVHFKPKKSKLAAIKKAVLPLFKSVWSPIYMLSLITMCVVQLRLLFFIGSLSQMLIGLTDGDQHTVDKYVYFFGIMQLMCLVTSPMIGAVMDYKIKETLANLRKEKEMKRKNSLANGSSQNSFRRNHSTSSLSRMQNQSTGSFKGFENGSVQNGGVPHQNGGSAHQNGSVPNENAPNGFKTRHMSLANIKSLENAPVGRVPVYDPLDDPQSRSTAKPAQKTRHLSLGNILKPEEREKLRNSSTGDRPRRLSLANLSANLSLRRRRVSSEEDWSVKPPMGLKIRKLMNGSWAFGITSALTVMFGVTVLINNLQVQVLSFVLHTVIRGFIHSACCGLYAITYPADQVGSLIGLQSMISACATLLQYPIFIAIDTTLEGDPNMVNIVLLGLSFLSFGLPIYMFYLARKMRTQQKKEHSTDYERLASQSSNGGKALEPLMEGEHSKGLEDVFYEEETGVAQV